MKKMRFMLLSILLLATAGSLFASGFALTGVGSRATAMGGAFRGLADDMSSMYWNPAGLGFLNETSIALGGTFILPSSSWETNAPLPGIPAAKYESKKKLRSFPTLLMTEERESRLKWGFSAFVPYGLGATWDAFTLPTVMPVTGVGNVPVTYAAGFPEEEMMSSLAIIDAHPTVAYQIMPNLSAGVGLSFMYGMIDILKTVPSATSSYYSPTTFDLSGSGIGFGANMGLLYKPMPRLSVGVSGKIPSKLYLDGEADVKLWLNNVVAQSLTGVNAPLVLGTTTGAYGISSELPLPGEIGGGLSFKVMPNWSVNLDYAYTMWSGLDKVTVDFDSTVVMVPGNPATNISTKDLNFDWKDTNRISVGTEYVRSCGMALRGGFFWEQSPIPDHTMSPTFPDINDKMSFNLGLGKTFGNITVDLNCQFVMFSERVVDTQTADNHVGTYNANSISGNLGLGYRF